MQVILLEGLLETKASPRGVGIKLPSTTESIDWLADLGGVRSAVPTFTPRDLSLSASEGIYLFYPLTKC